MGNTDLKKTALTTLGLIDLTSLNDSDTPGVVLNLCKQTKNEFGSVAAVCIYRQFIQTAREYFSGHKLNIKIATVTNFPDGDDDIYKAVKETEEAIRLGADEVDIVFPYKALIAGNDKIGVEIVNKARQVCGDKTLKVIIESGELIKPELIERASIISIENGADFIKTSTGKVKINATLEATRIMLNTIKSLNAKCGFKAAGGIRSVAEAAQYLQLAYEIMGDNWVNANNFRFGASSLLQDVLDVLNGNQSSGNANSY